MINIDKVKQALKELFPTGKVSEFFPYLEETFKYAGINSTKRAAMFIAQVGVESKGFTQFEEDLNYTTAERLVQMWPRRFRMPMKGEEDKEVYIQGKRNPYFYLRQPEKLANYVYGGRVDLGNRDEASGDGWRFRGKGPKQLTGADNVVRFQKAMKGILDKDYVNNSDELLNPRDGLYAAVWFWKSNKLNALADKADVVGVTKKVTGADTLLSRRVQLYNRAMNVLK